MKKEEIFFLRSSYSADKLKIFQKSSLLSLNSLLAFFPYGNLNSYNQQIENIMQQNNVTH